MIILNQRVILDERITLEKEEGIHHEIYQTIGPVWAHISLKRSHEINDFTNKPCIYSFVMRKSNRLTSCVLGRLHWRKQVLYVTQVCTAEKYPQYLIGHCLFMG
jgi:hypothetical protein